MSLQFSDDVRNARLNAIETAIGLAPILEIRSGAMPANCAANPIGVVLASLILPNDYMSDAAGASKSMSGSWADNAADAAGTAGYFRIWNAAKTVCHAQGSISATGGGGDLQLDNVVFAVGQAFSITQFTINEGNG